MKLQLPLPTYVISMDDDQGKRRMEKIHNWMEGDIRVVRGLDYPSGRDTELPEGMGCAFPIEHPYWYRIGCYAAHIVATKRAKEEIGKGYALILEDDAMPIGEWPELPKGDWSMATLSYGTWQKPRLCGSCGGAWMLRSKKQGLWWPAEHLVVRGGGHAYVLNLDNIEPYLRAMSFMFGPYDWQRSFACGHKPWIPVPDILARGHVIPRRRFRFKAFIHEKGIFKQELADLSMTTPPEKRVKR